MPNSVILVEHDSRWSQLAAEEAALIRASLADQVLSIHHVGSTAVPGIRAKPVIDLLVVVRDVDALDARQQALVDLGYVARGELGIPGRRFFSKDTAGTRTHHVHCFADGNPEVERHLLFRDYLLAYPEVATEYERLKVELAARFHDDRSAYTDAKTDFVRRIEAQARQQGSRLQGPTAFHSFVGVTK